jgi:hypothetical protein
VGRDQSRACRKSSTGRVAALCACAALSVGLLACGSSSKSSTRASADTARTAWTAQTEQLCEQKRAALAALGSVHITYGGIARVGLPAVKRMLGRYVGRLLVVLHTFELRQARLVAPSTLRSAAAEARQIDRQSQRATTRLKETVAQAKTPAALSAAFGSWTTTLRGLAARGDQLASRLNLPACRSTG